TGCSGAAIPSSSFGPSGRWAWPEVPRSRPSTEALDRCWGPRWRTGSGEAMFYSRRRRIINEIRRRVEARTARDERQAVDQLEQLRGTRSLDWLGKNGLNGR